MERQGANFKHCTRCGNKMPANDLFCMVCGTRVENSYATVEPQMVYTQNRNVVPKKKIKKGKIVLITVILLLIALVVAAFCVFFTSSAYDVSKKMKAQKYEKALDDYLDDVEDNFIQELILKATLNGYDDEIIEKFKSGKIDYDSALQALQTLEEMGFVGSSNRATEVTTIKENNAALEKGEQHYESGDYESAIKEYSKIGASSENYDVAQTKLNELYPKYIASVVEFAKSYNASKQYKEAIVYVNTAYDLLPAEVDKTELDNVKTESLAQYKAHILDEVTTLINANKFEDAIELLDEAITVDNNQEFISTKSTTEQKYVDYVTATAEAALKINDYSGALKIVQTALKILPSNSELTALEAKVIKETPTNLSDVVVIDSKGYSYKTDILTDSFGNNYGGYHAFHSRYGGAYVIYNMDQKYTEFTCSFVANKSARSDSIWSVAIYLDGKYECTLSDFTKTTGKKDIFVDVTNVTKLEIRCEGGIYDDANLAMVNATVK